MLSKNDIKFIRSLHQKKFRLQHSRFIAEGRKLIEEAIEHHPLCIDRIFATPKVLESFVIDDQFSVTIIDEKQLQLISTLLHPQGIIAICKVPEPLLTPSHKQVLVLDGIQDPGNFGTILRTAAWFGIHHVICSEDTVEIYNPKVVQATMGAVFQLHVQYRNLTEFLTQIDLPIYGAFMQGTNAMKQEFPKQFCLIMGNEGNGIRPELTPMIQYPITIPKYGKGESLNVAIAAGILMAEFTRGKKSSDF